MMTDELKLSLELEGYFQLREVPGRGVCGLQRMCYTVGLFYGMDKFSYRGRYCFEGLEDALEALREWDGQGDPGEEWIKHKGRIEYGNPKKAKFV